MDAEAAVKAPKVKKWGRGLTTLKDAFDEALGTFGKMTVYRADAPEVRAVDRVRVREEFFRRYPADNAKAKGAAFDRAAVEAVERKVLCSINTGPDLGQTIFWLAT
jgi:hypothetical protein